MKYKSKIAWWMHIVFLSIPILPISLTIWFIELGIVVQAISILSVCLLIYAFLIIPIWVNTYYVLGDTELRIRSGICSNRKISYQNILEINETKNPVASPALSLERIEIKHKKGNTSDVVFISPRDKEDFLQQLNKKVKLSRVC